MTVDRMAESLQAGRGAPVVDLIAPQAEQPRPADALDALLTAANRGELTPAEEDKIRALDRMVRSRAEHKRKYDALKPDIDRAQAELLELVVERQLVDAKGRPFLPDVDDGQGFELHPYFQGTIWPKFREDSDTQQPYGQEELVETLRVLELDHLVIERADANPYAAYVRERVKAWRQRVGETGVTNADGQYVDAYGNVLTGEEAADPLADILALPPLLRAIVEPVEQQVIKFSRREIASRAVADLEAIEGTGEDTPTADPE